MQHSVEKNVDMHLQAVLVSTLEAELGDCKLEQRAERALTRCFTSQFAMDMPRKICERCVFSDSGVLV